MNTNISAHLHNFSQDTKYVCGVMAVALFLILVFIISPLEIPIWKLTTSKIIILIIIAYAIYTNFFSTNKITDTTPNLFDNESLVYLRNSVLLNHLFSLVMVVLFIYICITLFD